MITVTQAFDFIAANQPRKSVQTVGLREALGRRAAQDIYASLTHPPLDGSAMDGYAVKLNDIGYKGASLTVIGEAPAGSPFKGVVASGQAVRIFTGGAIPKGTGTVIIQENVTRDKNKITVTEPQFASRHIRRAGLDFAKGQLLIAAGTVLGPAEIAVAAAAGQAKISVQKKLSISILSGGDELVAPDKTPALGQIINSNPYALAALIESWGHDATVLPTAKDTLDSLAQAISFADSADVIIPIGGASVGDHDHMRAAFKHAGLKLIFEKIAVRPGKPTWFGLLNERPVLGLPGNPASAMVCANVFARPLLTGEKAKFITAVLSSDIEATGPREHYQRAVMSLSNTGLLSVAPLPLQDSGLMTPFLQANGLLRRHAEAPARLAGELVEVLPIKDLF